MLKVLTKSLRIKLIFAVILLPSIFVTFLTALRIYQDQNTALHQVELNTKRVVNELAYSLSEPLWNFDVEQAKTLVKLKLQEKYFLGIEIKDLETDLTVFNLYQKDGKIVDSYAFDTDDVQMIPVQIRKNGRAFWEAKCYFTHRYVYEQIRSKMRYSLLVNLMWTAILVVLMIAMLNLLVIRPIGKTTDLIKRIAKGDFSMRIDVKQDDEIGEIANEVNKLLDQLESSISEVTMVMQAMAEGDFSKRMSSQVSGDLDKLKGHTNQSIEILSDRTRQLNQAQQELIDKAHQAGMADIASGTLHNVGNILNSVKVSTQMIKEDLKHSNIENFKKANDLLRENLDNLEAFITKSPKGSLLLEYYLKLEDALVDEVNRFQDNLNRLMDKIDMIADVIIAQQNYAGISSLTEKYQIDAIIDDALTLQSGSIERYGIQVIKKLSETPLVPVQKAKLMHILINLIKNAKESMINSPSDNRKLTISLEQTEQYVQLSFQDTGVGIEPSALKKIFTHGYTTKKDGHGFGLHSCANYMAEMGGKIWATSEGLNKGSTFVLQFDLGESSPQ